MKIRAALPSDSDCLTEIAIRSKSYWGYSSDFIDLCREELSVSANNILDDSYRYNVLELDSSIVGFYALEKISKFIMELDALFVEQKFMGKGVGKSLILHAKKCAQNLGAKTIVIQSDPNAVGFYLATGAILTGEQESLSIAGRFLPMLAINLD